MHKTTISLFLGCIICSIGSLASAQTACTMQYDPVCGSDGVTYSNACTAIAADKTITSAGECKTGTELEQALKTAYQFGITKYSSLTDFKPETLVTREQISKMVLQFAKALNRTNLKGNFDCTFTDLNTTDPTLTNYISDACNQGMIKGWDKAFHPQQNVSNAQAITILMRIINGKQTEPEQRWTPYEQYAIKQGYLKQGFSQPLGLMTRGDLIILMNTIYNKSTQSNKLYETWVIDATYGTCINGNKQCMQISRNGGANEIFNNQIEGFSYVEGYTYTVQVMGTKTSDSIQRSLISINGHTSTNGKPETLPQPGCDWTKIDNTTLSIRGQTCSTDEGSITVSYDQTLPGVIISSKKAQVTTQTPIIHLFVSSATGLQSLLFNTHSAMIKQGIVTKSASCIFKQNSGVIGSKIDRFDFTVDSGSANCGTYAYSSGSASYFIKPKGLFTTMIYVNNNEERRKYIDRSSLNIK